MAGRIKIEPYKQLDVSTPAVPGGGYIDVDASAGRFGPSPLLQFGLQVAEGATGIAGVVAQQLALDDEAVVKDADLRLGQAEQTLLFDPQHGYLNTQGQTALTHAPAVLEAYGQAQQREIAALANDEQRRMLENLAQRRLTTFGEQVERHGAAERLRWHDAASEQRIAQMRTDAGFYWSDDALLRPALGTTRAEVRDKAERHGLASPLTEAALRQHTSRTLVSAIEAAVDRDPDRAQALRKRYAAVIEDHDRVALDALLSEARTRQRAEAASTEILNATPPDDEQPTPQWRLRQAEAIADPAVRAATIRRVLSASAATGGSARALGEQVLARVLKNGLTDPSQIPVREWVALDAERRQAIETRLDHNARGTEPAPKPALVDELATQMTQAPSAFARRDLVPSVAHLPLPQWQRFRDWQAGIRRNDPATEGQLYAIKRGQHLATKVLPASVTNDDATNIRAGLVEEIDTWRRVTGKSPDDADIADMLQRYVSPAAFVPRTLEGDPHRPPGIHQVQDRTTYSPNAEAMKRLVELAILQKLDRAAREALSKGILDDTGAYAAALELVRMDKYPSRINPNGQAVYFDPQRNRYVVRNTRGGHGFWIEFDAQGELLGAANIGLNYPIPDSAQPSDVDLEEIWILPSEPPEQKPSPPSSDPAEPRSTKPPSPPPLPPPVPPPPASPPPTSAPRQSASPPKGGDLPAGHRFGEIFEKAGIPTHRHFRQRLKERASRGITEANALETYRWGRGSCPEPWCS